MAQSLGIELALSTIENAGDIGRVIESFASLPNGGLVFPPNATTTANRDLIVALAAIGVAGWKLIPVPLALKGRLAAWLNFSGAARSRPVP